MASFLHDLMHCPLYEITIIKFYCFFNEFFLVIENVIMKYSFTTLHADSRLVPLFKLLCGDFTHNSMFRFAFISGGVIDHFVGKLLMI